MPPTMILIAVCACAGAADRSEADIAAKTAAARILRMGRFLVTAFSCGAWREVFCRAAGSTGGRFRGLFGAMRPPALSRVNRTFGVLSCPRQAQGRVKLAMRRLVKAQPAQAARGRSQSAKKRGPRPNQFYLIPIVILFETSGGLNG